MQKTHTHRHRHTESHTYTQREKQTDRQTDGGTDRRTDRQTDRETDGRTDGRTDRTKDTDFSLNALEESCERLYVCKKKKKKKDGGRDFNPDRSFTEQFFQRTKNKQNMAAADGQQSWQKKGNERAVMQTVPRQKTEKKPPPKKKKKAGVGEKGGVGAGVGWRVPARQATTCCLAHSAARVQIMV